MIVQILDAQRDGQEALRQQGALLMNDQRGMAWIGNDIAQGVDQAELAVHFTQQQCPGVGSDRPAGKIRQDGATPETGKNEGFVVTVCSHDGLASLQWELVVKLYTTSGKAIALWTAAEKA